MQKIIEKCKKFLFPPQVEKEDHRLEDEIHLMVRQYQTNDPATDTRWRQLKTAMEVSSRRKIPTRIFQQTFLLRPAFLLSAAIAVIVVAGLIWMKTLSPRIYETARGQHSTITLLDSTVVTMNYLSKLSVNRWVLDDARRVSLNGEAFFHVQKNGMPFILTTGVGTVHVLGTQFNVRVRDEKMEVAVLSGSVRVSVNRDGKDSSIILTKGQIAVCMKDEYPGRPVSLPFADYPGWLQGKITCYRTTLGAICKELESQLDIKITIENPLLSAATLTGTIDGQNAEAALTTLVQLTGNAFRYEAGSYIIY